MGSEIVSSRRKPFETFAHYRLGKGHATLSISVDDGHTKVGIAFCHPRDGFSKQFGRTVAQGRRDSADNRFAFTFERNEQRLVDQVRAEFERHVVNATKINSHADAPSWVVFSLRREQKRRLSDECRFSI